LNRTLNRTPVSTQFASRAIKNTGAGLAGTAFPTRAPLVVGTLWLLMASSGIVNIEPAPFDLLAAGLCILYFLIGLKVPRNLQAPIMMLAMLLLANAASIILAPSVSAPSASEMLVYAGLTVYLIVIWLVLSSVVAADTVHVMRTLWNGWLVAAVLAVILGLAGYFKLVPGHDAFLMAGRAKALFKDANVYAPFLIPVALYLLARIRSGQPVRNVSRLMLFAFLMAGLLVGFSRGAWGNFVISALVLAALAIVNARSLQSVSGLFMTGIVVVFLGAGILALAVSTPQLSEMLEVRASLLQEYDTGVGGRFSTQKAAFTEIARHPAGIGPGRSEAELCMTPHNG